MAPRSQFPQFHFFSVLAVLALAGGCILLLLAAGGFETLGSGLVLLAAGAAAWVTGRPTWRDYSFTAWVLVCVGGALAHPGAFDTWFDWKLTLLIVPLVQIIMFGMGTTLSLKDFGRVLVAPWPILVGVALQFSIMPVVGFLVARSFGFEGEIAAGIILIGACSGGVASNLMAYLARGNVALSVTMTCISTLLAPLMTPLMMRLLAGTYIEIPFLGMMLSILNMIIVPLVGGLLAHAVLYSSGPWVRKGLPLAAVVLVAVGVAALAAWIPAESLGRLAMFKGSVMIGGVLLALVGLAKLVMSVWLGRSNNWMDRVLPLVSMAGICAILTIIIAQTHDVLMAVGIVLVFAAVIHNALGYLLGYWGARGMGTFVGWLGFRLGVWETPASRIDEAACRTVSLEVGMQNGGMATGLAIDVLKSHVAALPPNVFGTWMNISGSMLANWWKRRRPQEIDGAQEDQNSAEVSALSTSFEK